MLRQRVGEQQQVAALGSNQPVICCPRTPALGLCTRRTMPRTCDIASFKTDMTGLGRGRHRLDRTSGLLSS